MTFITTCLRVSAEGTISATDTLPAGGYTVTVDLAEGLMRPTRPFRIEDIPVHDLGPWPTGASWGRDEIYGDDGR